MPTKTTTFLAISLLTLTACFPEPDCTSSVGTTLYGSNDCAGFNEHMKLTVAAFAKHVPAWTEEYSHYVLDAFKVEIKKGAENGTWFEPQVGMRVAGLTYCEYQAALVGSTDWKASALSHEAAHFMENCRPVDRAHTRWVESGIMSAIHEAQGLVKSQALENCPYVTQEKDDA